MKSILTIVAVLTLLVGTTRTQDLNSYIKNGVFLVPPRNILLDVSYHSVRYR